MRPTVALTYYHLILSTLWGIGVEVIYSFVHTALSTVDHRSPPCPQPSPNPISAQTERLVRLHMAYIQCNSDTKATLQIEALEYKPGHRDLI